MSQTPELCRSCGWGTLSPEDFSASPAYTGDHECQKCHRVCVIRNEHKPDGTDPYEDFLCTHLPGSGEGRVWFYQLLAKARKETRPHTEWLEADLADLRTHLEQECHPGTQEWHDTFTRVTLLLSGEASSCFGPLYAWNGQRVSPSELCTKAVECRQTLESLVMGCESVIYPLDSASDVVKIGAARAKGMLIGTLRKAYKTLGMCPREVDE